MHHAHGPEPFKILVVTEDRALVRQVSRFLDTVGYEVLQAAEAHSAIAAIEAEEPQFLLLGFDLASRDDWELCSWLGKRSASHEAYRFLMVEEPDDVVIREALEAGVDDILLLPLDYGELLSRLRAAVRVLEFDRRATRQTRVDTRTGLMTRSALIAAVRRELAERVGSSAPRVACVTLDVDFFNRVNRLQGAIGGDELLKAVTQELSKLRSGSEMLGALSPGRFAAILPGATDTAAVEWAEHARRVLAAARFKLGETNWQLTASFGVAGCDAAESAEQLLEQANEALSIAKASGRNCVVRYGEQGAEIPKVTSKLFERTVACDVMTPCTIVLEADETLAEAASLFRRTGLEGLPVVDDKGHLVGLLSQEAAADRSGKKLVKDAMTSDPQSFSEQEPLGALLDFFSHDPRSIVVIVRNSRPVGFITCDSLGGLSQTLSTGSFANDAPYSDTSDYLLVPDRCVLAGESA